MPIKNEIAQAVYSMLEAFTVFNDHRELTAPIGHAAGQFNGLLADAQQSCPTSRLVQHIEPLRSDDRVIDLVARLAVLKSVIDSELIRLNRGYVLGQEFRYWRHTCGHYYAVELRRGQLYAACGPVAFEDVDTRMLPHLSYETGETLHWVEQRRREFTVHMGS